MVRRSNKSLNSSVITVTNESTLQDDTPDFKEFIKRFRGLDLEILREAQLVGFDKTIEQVRSRIERVLNPNANVSFALVTGPSGTGKTMVVCKIAQEFENKNLTFFYLKASWILQKRFGDVEQNLNNLFDEAIAKSPSMIYIDKIELICNEKRTHNDAKDRIYNVLEDNLDNLNQNPKARVLVFGATDKPEVLDQQIRNYLSHEIRFNLPSRDDRKLYLQRVLGKENIPFSEIQLDRIADLTHCYLYRDLREVCDIPTGQLSLEAVKLAVSRYKPVAIKTVTTPCPPLHWDDIGGVDEIKKKLQQAVTWRLEHRDKFQELGIRPKKGAILYGPPGCSKTMLAQALATESGYNFISVKGPELFSKFVGDSEAAVRRLYRNAREIAPCIIFFDEIDGLATERSGDNHSSSVGDKVVTQLLNELNFIDPLDNVFTIAATNRPDRLDSALMRPGRLGAGIYIPLPSDGDRRAIFKVHLKPLSYNFDRPVELAIEELARLTAGYSGAEICEVCTDAGELALSESLPLCKPIEWRHFEAALEKVKPRTKEEQLKLYERFNDMKLDLSSMKTYNNNNNSVVCETKLSSPQWFSSLIKIKSWTWRRRSSGR